MDVKRGSFRSLYGIRWPVLGLVRSNVQTHRLGGILQDGHPKNSTRFASGPLLDMKHSRKYFCCLL
jgi:hypothetical protein